MTLTPSTSSGFLSGMGASALLWTIILKINCILKPLGLSRFTDRERILDWIDGNKGLFVIIVETINMAMHGISNSASVAIALGIAVFNSFVVFACLPLRKILKRQNQFL